MAALLALAPATTLAQSNTDGAIVGQADDMTATIMVESLATGAKHPAKVTSTRTFRVGALPPGRYKVTMTKPGAAPVEREVSVAVGATTGVVFDDTEVLETLTVSDTPINPIDFAKIESSTVFSEAQLDVLPVVRNTSAVALLAPGTTRGDVQFGDDSNLVSFGGASVAENAYYINGMNVSNFRNGLDPAQIPFDAYSQFEVLAGAYSAQYGRSTGGVVNATTKGGSNQFHGGLNVYFSPDSLSARPPSSFYYTPNATPYTYNRADYNQTLEANVYASGPLIKDKLFFYGIYNHRRIEDDDAFATLGTFDEAISDDPFWLVKLDALPFANQRFEYTGFRDKRTRTATTYNYDFDTDTRGAEGTDSWEFRGGTTHVGRYTGVFGDNFTVSAMFGQSEQDRRTLSETDIEPLVLDARSGTVIQLAGNTSATGVIEAESLDTRKAYRLDFEYAFSLGGEHRLRAGLDFEDNESIGSSAYASPPETGYWRYILVPAGGAVAGVTFANPTEVARFRVLENGGTFQVKSNAYYIEDNWSLANDRMLLRLGVRNEEFENLNANGEQFIHIKNQWAPRLGLSYDLSGDRKTKVFLNYGRYHLPVASNTNLRLAGGEVFTQAYYSLNSLNPDFTPNVGAQIGTTDVLSNGEIPDTRTVLDTTIKPMYQDELVVGLQHRFAKNFTAGVRGIVRDLGTTIDDVLVDHALAAWGQRNGYDTSNTDGAFHYVLANPGRTIHTAWDFDEDGTLEEVDLTVEDLGYPKAERKYYAVELFAERVWDGKWTAQASYTWAHSYGNSEGWVLSDNGQDDAGITVMFDTPDLTMNTYGNLPNDVRHHFKVFGSYALTPDFTVGMNSYLKSGRPINRLGNFDDTVIGDAYGFDYHIARRGSAGTTPWVFNLDLSLRWAPRNLGSFLGDRFTAQIDFLNILDFQSATEVYESAEEDGVLGSVNPRYGINTSWQSPRSVRFSIGYEF